MITDEIRTHLEEATAGLFAVVQEVGGLAAITGNPPQTPTAYVCITEEAAPANELANGVLQLVETDVAVVIITANAGDALAAGTDIEPLKHAVRTALVGYQPPSGETAITLVTGRLMKAAGGFVWWEYLFATSYYVEG